MLAASGSTPSQSVKRRHDRSTDEFSVMRLENRREKSGRLVVDALSIGTQHNLDLLHAQQRTRGSAKSVRHFFASTELDHADPSCHKSLDNTTIQNITNYCRQEKPFAKGGMRIQFEQFSKGPFKRKGGGWYCAQQRFALALEKLGVLYRKQQEFEALPDFLLIQDDDTYYNMVLIETFLLNIDPSIPLAEAPCLFRYAQSRMFSYPWGGFGFILSRGAIENLVRPIYCNSTQSDDFEQNVCSRLKDDMIGEQRFFQDGMSISDLMGAQVRNNLFIRFSKENWAYCLHGDWALGYFVNFYYIANHIKEGFKDVAEVRIEDSLGGIMKKTDKGNCKYRSVEECTKEAHVCHRQNAESMENRTIEVATASPGVYRT